MFKTTLFSLGISLITFPLLALTSNLSHLTFLLFLIALFLFVLLFLFFLPLVLIRLWECTPFPESPLKTRLEALCKRGKFRHAGMLIWKSLPKIITAAIVGTFPRFRYILFTDSLVKNFPEEEIYSVTAHEIGHSSYHHLTFYPLLLLGLFVLIGLFSQMFYAPLQTFFFRAFTVSGKPFFHLALLLIYFFLVIGYFRYVFGLFSRNFEKQADLHVFALGISPELLKSALMRIATMTNLLPSRWDWHHGSIAERLALLDEVSKQPNLKEKFHRRIWIGEMGYIVFLLLGLWILAANSLI